MYLPKNKNLIGCLLFFFLLSGQTVFSQSDLNVERALEHLRSQAEGLNLTAEDVGSLRVTDSYVSAHNDVAHIYFNQTFQEAEVFGAMLGVHLLPDGQLLHLGNRLVTDLPAKINTLTPQITPVQAVETVLEAFNIPLHAPFILTEQTRINAREVHFRPDGIALEPIRTKLIYAPVGNTLRLAYEVNLYELSAQNDWNVRTDAVTGEILAFNNQVVKCNFGSPEEVCRTEHTHSFSHPVDFSITAADDVNNAYNVYPLYVESPNHGDQNLVVAPADEFSSPFGWHDTDGAEGHEYTITRGNNVHAYADIFDLNTSPGLEPDGGDSLYFDFPYDESNNEPHTQVDAAITNLFYWNNLMHDIWYRYGFDEVSGNFQANNYGSEGEAGDYIRAECLDGSGTFNANFRSGSDGFPARMQMYRWGTGPNQPGDDPELLLTSPAEAAGGYPMRPAAFGPPLPGAGEPINAALVLVNDGTVNGSLGCQDLINGDELAGNIALIDRGECNEDEKILRAQQAGAVAAVICNDTEGSLSTLMPDNVAGQVNIPAVMIGMEDCMTIKMNLADAQVSFYPANLTIPLPGPTGFDSDLDNGVICHEYGHGVSIRLTGGPSTSACLFNEEQAGEGWSDWVGLVLTTTPEDNADEPRGIGTYVNGDPTDGTGIRTYPYSRDMEVNPHTYRGIRTASIPHGVGSVWCAMIWDLYWNLVDEYGHDEDIYNGTGGNNIAMQLVIDGMKLQACSPTFIDSRDAILAADVANYGGANECIIWQTFARRGLGIHAEAGGEEDFTLPIQCTNALAITKSGGDAAFAGETVDYTIEIANGLSEDVSNYVVTDTLPVGMTYVEGSATCGASVEGNILTLTYDNLPSFTYTPCTYTLQLEEGDYGVMTREDGFEGGLEGWQVSGSGASEWTASTADPYAGSGSAFAAAPPAASDQYLKIPEPLQVPVGSPALGFWHKFDTQEGRDGGVIEITFAGATLWTNMDAYILAGDYNSKIDNDAASPLAGEPAFSGDSDGYMYTLVDLSAFPTGNMDIRFRFATDDSGAGGGWHIDNFHFFNNQVSDENVACATNQNDEEICSRQPVFFLNSVVTSNENIVLNVPRVTLFPNPNDGSFALDVSSSADSEALVNVYGTDGRLLMSDNFSVNRTHEINLAMHGAGVYFAEIITDEMQTVKKVVVRQ